MQRMNTGSEEIETEEQLDVGGVAPPYAKFGAGDDMLRVVEIVFASLDREEDQTERADMHSQSDQCAAG